MSATPPQQALFPYKFHVYNVKSLILFHFILTILYFLIIYISHKSKQPKNSKGNRKNKPSSVCHSNKKDEGQEVLQEKLPVPPTAVVAHTYINDCLVTLVVECQLEARFHVVH